MRINSLLSPLKVETSKEREKDSDALGNSSILLNGITADPNNNKGEFLFGDNVTKRMAEYKTSLNTLLNANRTSYFKKL